MFAFYHEELLMGVLGEKKDVSIKSFYLWDESDL